jgi:hypothetical protein
MDAETLAWWSFLCGVSALNAVVWAVSAHRLKHQAAALPDEAWNLVKWQMLLSAGYVLGCGYRSVFPVFDVQRQVMIDSWLSSVIVGRSVATVAELCFAAQWALMLRSVARSCDSQFALRVSYWIVPMILVAETFSWYSVLTTSNIGHVLEETLWGFSAAMLVISLAFIWRNSDKSLRPMLLATGVMGVGYVMYMLNIDVPMYWERWVRDEGQGRQYLDVAQGLADTSSRWVVSHRWEDWKSEVIWMSLYFSVAVWMSIGLMHAAARTARLQPAKATEGASA